MLKGAMPCASAEPPASRQADLERIRRALALAGRVLRAFRATSVGVRYKAGTSPVTEADLAVDQALRRALPRPDEGWLSEESPDDRARLERRRVWVVDPLDGTREFLEGIPDWCVSIGLVEDGVAVAGGVYAPARRELFLGAVGVGATLNGRPVRASTRPTLEGGLVLVSRWALRRRGRRAWQARPYRVRPVGPVAYALALIAAGRAEAAWDRATKAEWDVAAGAALVVAAGGHVTTWDGAPLVFNRWPPRIPGLVATGPHLLEAVRRELAPRT